jgi:hypothetical protein
LLAFLKHVLPTTGLYVAARFVGNAWRHQVCATIEELAQVLAAFDASGVPTYYATAAFVAPEVDSLPDKDGKTYKQVRVQRNVRALRSFFMDLDCGENKGFASQEEALDKLVEFVNQTKLPMPTVVSSGNGIHLYWTLTNEINPDQWKQTAASLKALCAHHGFRADPAVTSDPARVLRPVGTYNRKSAGDPRAVELVSSAPDVQYREFSAYVSGGLKAAGVKPPEVIKQRETAGEKLNEQFAIQRDFPPCSAEKVASRCAQLAKVRDTKGCVPEPHWYAAIQLMVHATEGDELIHQWSNGYAGYSHTETEGKIAQVRSGAMGPTLCRTFEDRNPGGCEGCPFKGKINSPAQLGATVPRASAPVVTVAGTAPVGDESAGSQPARQLTLPNPPAPFTRKLGTGTNGDGGIYVEDEGILHKIYDYDCYPIDLLFDEGVGHEVVQLRHWLPQEGWREVSVQSSLLAKPTEFEVAIRDHGIVPLIKSRFCLYMDAYIRELRRETKVRRMFRTMGWKAGGEFVLGESLYQRDGTIATAGSSASINKFLSGFHAKGDLDTWIDMTRLLDSPACAAHAFTLLTAFAAPLLEVGKLEGFTVSLLGETGTGKSTMGRFLASVYGNTNKTWLDGNATALARVEALGAYNAVPVYIDELTTIDPEELRDLVYMIPTGKGRSSLTRNREIRQGAEWKTILITSTNDSLHETLKMAKADPEAESMRLFEFPFPKVDEFIVNANELLHPLLNDNYGVVGGEYIKHLVQEQDLIRGDVQDAVLAIQKEFGMEGKERFWSRAAALTLYAGKLAQKWGLIGFNPEIIRPWLRAETRRMRHEVNEGRSSPMDILAEYLDTHIAERLVVTSLNSGFTGINAKPIRLTQRYDKDSETLWVSSGAMREWVNRRHKNYAAVEAALVKLGVFKEKRKVRLGAGTDIKGGNVDSWKIDMNDTHMQGVIKLEEVAV